jgi:hypothetical protein
VHWRICPGESGVDNSTYIRNVNTLAQPIVAGIDGVTVRLVDGRLGHGVSSRRYKQDIKPMEEASEALYALKPVTFHYNKEIDPTQTLDFGLIAEEVAEVNPELAVRDGEGKISKLPPRRDQRHAAKRVPKSASQDGATSESNRATGNHDQPSKERN